MMTLSIVPQDDALVSLLASLRDVGSGSGLIQTQRALEGIAKAVSTKWQMQVGSKYKINKPEKLNAFTQRVSSDEKMVHWLEYGLPAYDMRQTHTRGKKSRVVKPRIGAGGKIISQWKVKNKDGTYRTVMAGSSYLIIPFMHDTKSKGNIEDKSLGDVYNDVKKQMGAQDFKRSKQTVSRESSNTSSPNVFGDMVKRAEYEWGTRIEFPDSDEFDNLQGMVAMNEPKQSSFMTFRVVSVNSPATTWQHPGIKARHNLKNIIENGQDEIRNVLEGALRRDLGNDIV